MTTAAKKVSKNRVAKKVATKQEMTIQQGGVPAQPMGMADQLLAMAIDKDLDIEKLKQLIELRDQEEQKTAKSLYDAAMAKCQAEMQPVLADAENIHCKDAKGNATRYSKLQNIVTSLKPIYTSHGFSVDFHTGETPIQRLADQGWFRIFAECTHIGGFTKTHFVDLPADTVGAKGTQNKTVIHGVKSTLTYARTILMGMIFNFVTYVDVDDDGNAAGANDTITPEDAAIIKDELEALDADVEYWCDWIGIPSIDEMPLKLLGKARKSIADQKKSRGVK